MTTATDQALANILVTAARERVAMFTRQLVAGLGTAVREGPFAGTELLATTSWGDGDLGAKILGSYEAELHPALQKAAKRRPDVVINVGCAEGFYAIGLARLLPEARVFAFDINPDAQRICAEAAARNGVGDRVTVGGLCTGDDLVALTTGARHALIVMDCEGAERDLLAPEVTARLGRCDVIVECHDFMDATITPTLTAALGARHAVETVVEVARDGAQYAVLRTLNSLDRALMVNEFRPTLMHWLVAWAR